SLSSRLVLIFVVLLLAFGLAADFYVSRMLRRQANAMSEGTASPLTMVEQNVSAMRLRLWEGILFFIAVTASTFFAVSASTSRRIRKLQEFSQRMAAGDFRPIDFQAGGGELEGLARALNHTASHLQKTVRVLTDERNRSAAIL